MNRLFNHGGARLRFQTGGARLLRALSCYLLLLLCIATAAHAQNLLRSKPQTNDISVLANSNFIPVEIPGLGTNSTHLISASNLLESMKLFPGWPSGLGTLTTVKTNGANVSTAAASVNFVEGTNVVLRSTNTAGAVTVQINAVAGSGVGDVSTAQLLAASNAAIAAATRQVGTNFSATNLYTWGLTNTGTFTNTSTASIGGALDVGGTAEFRNTAAVYTELNVFGDINQDTVGGYTTTLGPTTHLTNSFTAGTNESRWVKFAILAPDSVLKTDANRLASVDDALTWASARLNESTNRLPWRVVPGDNISNLLATIPNSSLVDFAPGNYTVNCSILNSNLYHGNTYTGLLLSDKTNVTLRGVPGLTVLDGSASLGTLLFVSNCFNVRFEGLEFKGYTNDNRTLLPGYSPITLAQGAFLWASVDIYRTRNWVFDTCHINGSADHGIQDKGGEYDGTPASTDLSTNGGFIINSKFSYIGGYRTNSTSPTNGYAVDGAAVISTTANLSGCYFEYCFRAWELYNESDSASRVFYGAQMNNCRIYNTGDIPITFAGSTNAHFGIINNVVIENDRTFSFRGTNFGGAGGDHLGYGIVLNGGRGWKLSKITVRGPFYCGMFMGNATSFCDDFDLDDITFIDIDSGAQDFGQAAIIGTFGNTAADASSVRRLNMRNVRVVNCRYGGVTIGAGRDITIDGLHSYNPSGLGSANPVFAGLRIGRDGNSAASLTNITVRNSQQVSSGASAWAYSIADNVQSLVFEDNTSSGFTIASLTNNSTSAALEFPDWNFRSATNIATATFRATNTASIGALHMIGGTAGSSLLRTDSNTNLATVTIGANLSFDGTTLSASTAGTIGPGALDANQNQFNTNGNLNIKTGALVTNLQARGVTDLGSTASRVAVFNASQNLTNSPGVDTTELEYLDGVTSAIQTQLNGKQNGQTNANQFGASTTLTIASGALVTNLSARGVTIPIVTASRVAAINASGNITNSQGVDLTELEYLDGVTSALQTQLNGKQNGQTNGNQFGASTTLTIASGALTTNAQIRGVTPLGLTASRAAMVDASGNLTNVTSGSPSTEYVKADGTTGTPAGGSGGTNFPPVINQLGSTNLSVTPGVRQVVTLTTNASFAFNLNGTPLNGSTFILAISNYSASAIYMTTFVASASSSAYFPANASNVTVFAVPATSIRWLEFLSETNFNLGTARWNIIRDQGKEMELTAGPGVSFGTNSAGTYITNTVHAVLQNLVGTVGNNVTNENSTALQINSGTLTITPGNVSNLVNNTTIDFQPGNQITNVIAIKEQVWTNYVQTGSNYVFSFNTNYVEFKNQTNLVFTNIVEEATAIHGKIVVHVHNTTGVTMGLVWPAYGAQHGYFLQTNVNNPVLTSTSLTTGKHGVASIECFGTNIFATWTEWP